jgi:hypothetical protein
MLGFEMSREPVVLAHARTIPPANREVRADFQSKTLSARRRPGLFLRHLRQCNLFNTALHARQHFSIQPRLG